MSTLVPYRHVPGWNGPAPVHLLEAADWIHAGVATFCTGPDGDPHGNLCLCHWSPWVDRAGFPDQDHKPLVGDPLADVPAAEPWQPQRRRESRRSRHR